MFFHNIKLRIDLINLFHDYTALYRVDFSNSSISNRKKKYNDRSKIMKESMSIMSLQNRKIAKLWRLIWHGTLDCVQSVPEDTFTQQQSNTARVKGKKKWEREEEKEKNLLMWEYQAIPIALRSFPTPKSPFLLFYYVVRCIIRLYTDYHSEPSEHGTFP